MASSTPMLPGKRDSPRWKRGCLPRSKRITRRPRAASRAAHTAPAGPPPTTTASNVSMGAIVVPRRSGGAAVRGSCASLGCLGRRSELDALADVRADQSEQNADAGEDEIEKEGHRAHRLT